jgi:hypothetical protein
MNAESPQCCKHPRTTCGSGTEYFIDQKRGSERYINVCILSDELNEHVTGKFKKKVTLSHV